MNKLLLENVKIKYVDSAELIIDVNTVVFHEGTNFIIGKNGCGKSTLLKAFTSNEDIEVEGKITYNSNPLTNSFIGVVNQNPLTSITPELTFIESLIQAKSNYYDLLKLSNLVTKSEKKKVIDFLENFKFDFDLKILFEKESAKLSSGQQQLLAILMRVYRSGKILLLDECTANLDSTNAKLIMDTLLRIAEKGVIILFATHQLDLIELKETKTFIIENKKIFEKNENYRRIKRSHQVG